MTFPELVYRYNGCPLTPQVWDEILVVLSQWELRDKVSEACRSFGRRMEFLNQPYRRPINEVTRAEVHTSLAYFDHEMTSILNAKLDYSVDGDWIWIREYKIDSYTPIKVSVTIWLDRTSQILNCRISQ